MYVAKLDLDGNIIWQKVIGGDKYDFASSAIPASDGGFIVAGYSESGSIAGSNTNHGYTDIVLMKLDADTGNVLWSKLIGGKYGEATAFDNVIQPTTDGGYILAGQSSSSQNGNVEGRSHGSSDVWIVRFDDEYEIQWETLLGGVEYDDGTTIHQTADGSYIMVGRTMSGNSGDVGENNGNVDLWVVKIDADGNLLWQDALGGSGYEQSSAIQPTADDGFIVAAFTRSTSSGNIGLNHGYEDAWLAKLKPRLVVDVKDADTSTLVPNARVMLTDITHAEDLEMNATSGRTVLTGSGISGQYRFGRGLEYSVKVAAEKYHDGRPADVTFAHDGELVTLQITAVERPVIDKTFSITNSMYDKNAPTYPSTLVVDAVKKRLDSAGWGEPIFNKAGSDVTRGIFGGDSSAPIKNINDATLHYHAGHGSFIGQLTPGNSSLIISKPGISGNFNGDWFNAQDVQNKWGGKNKWVVLHSCNILKDKKWGDVLGTTHGVFGFATVSDMDPDVPNQFFSNALEGKTLYYSWKSATCDALRDTPAATHFDENGELDYSHDTIDIVAAVYFKTSKQKSTDHLPGKGDIAPDGGPEDVPIPYAWNCHTGEEVPL